MADLCAMSGRVDCYRNHQPKCSLKLSMSYIYAKITTPFGEMQNALDESGSGD